MQLRAHPAIARSIATAMIVFCVFAANAESYNLSQHFEEAASATGASTVTGGETAENAVVFTAADNDKGLTVPSGNMALSEGYWDINSGKYRFCNDLFINGGNLTINGGHVGTKFWFVMNGASTFTITGGEFVTAEDNGASNPNNGAMDLGRNDGSDVTVNIKGGTVTSHGSANGGDKWLAMMLANGSNSKGKLTVSKTGKYTSPNDISVGRGSSSAGELTVKENGVFNAWTMYVAHGSSSKGTFNIQDNASVALQGQLQIGVGTGTDAKMYVTGGKVSVNDWLVIGIGERKYNALLDISGGEVTHNGNNTHITIASRGGDSSKAEVKVHGTGKLSSNANIYIGERNVDAKSRADATLTIDDNAVVDNSGAMVIFSQEDSNNDSVLTLNLNGGTLTTQQLRREKGNGKAVVKFGGGTLKATANATEKWIIWRQSGFDLSGTLIADTESAIDTSGRDLIVNIPISGMGSLVKKGAGTLTFTGGFFGELKISSEDENVGAVTTPGNQTLSSGAIFLASGINATMDADQAATLSDKNFRIENGAVMTLTGITLDFSSSSEQALFEVSSLQINGSDIASGETDVTGYFNVDGAVVPYALRYKASDKTFYAVTVPVELASGGDVSLPSWYTTNMKLIISGDTTLVVPQGTPLGDVEFRDNGKIVYTLSTYTAGETASVGSIGTVTYPENETIANHIYISVGGVRMATVADTNGVLTAAPREVEWIGTGTVDYTDNTQWQGGAPGSFDIAVFGKNATISSAHPAMKLTSGATLSCSGASYTFTKLVIDSTCGAIDDLGKKISFDGAVTGAGVLTKKGAGIVNFKGSSVGCGVTVDEGAFILPAGASVGALTIGKKGVVAVDLSAVSNTLSAEEGSNEINLFTATNLTFEDGDKDSLDTTVFLTGPVVSYTLNEDNGTVKAEITDISHKNSTRKITTWNGGLYTGEDMPEEYHIDNNTHWSDGMPSGSAQGSSYDIAVIPGDARIFLWSVNVMSYGDLVVRHGTLNIERNTGAPEVKVRRITGVGTIVQPDSTGYANVGDDSMTVASTITIVCEKRNNSHLWIYPKNRGSIVFNGDIDVSNGEVEMYARTVVGNIIVGSGAVSKSVYLRDANSSITINGAATILDGATFDFANAPVTFGDNASLVLKGGAVANLNYSVPALEVAGGDYVYSTLHATVENRPIMLSGGLLKMTAAEAKSTEGRRVVVSGGTLVIDMTAEEITAAGQSLELNAITSADSATAQASITLSGKPFDWTVTVPENDGVVTVTSKTADILVNKWIGTSEGNLEDAGNWEYGVPGNTQTVCFDKDVVANRSDNSSKGFWKKLQITNGATVELHSVDGNYPTYQLAEGIEGNGTLLLTRCGISAASQDVIIPETITIDTRNNGGTSNRNDSWLNTSEAGHSITVNGPVVVQHYLVLRSTVVLNGDVNVKSGAQLKVDTGTTTINGRLLFENGGTLSGAAMISCGEQAVLELKGGAPSISGSAMNKFSDVILSGAVTLPYDGTPIEKLSIAEGGALTVDMTKVDSPVENTPVTIVTSFNGDETAVKYSDTYKWQWTFSKGEGSSLLATPVDSSVNTWTGNSEGAWENSSNWRFGVPQKGQTVKFDKNVQVLINGDKTVSTIDVASGVRVLVKSTNVGTIHPTLRPAAMTGAGTVALHHAGIIPSVAMTIPDTLTIEIEKVNDANTIDSWLEGDTSETALTINAPIIGNGYVIFRDYVVLGGDNSKYAGKVLKDDQGDIKFTSSNAASAAATWDIYCDVYTTTLTEGTLKFGSLNLSNQKLWHQNSNSTMTNEVGALGQDMQFGGNYFFGTENWNDGTNPGGVTLKKVGSGKLTNASYGIRKMVVAGGEMVLATPTHSDSAWESYKNDHAGYQIDSLVVEKGATLSGTTAQTVTSVKFEDGAYYRLTRTSEADTVYDVNSLTAANIEFGKNVYLYLNEADRVKAAAGTVLSGNVTGSPMATVLNEAKTGIAACNGEGWYWTASKTDSGVNLVAAQVAETSVNALATDEATAETPIGIRDADLAAWLTVNSATESVNTVNANGVTGILAYMLGAEDYTNATKPMMGATVADGVATLTFDDSAFRRVPGLKLAYYLESCDKADFPSDEVTTSAASDDPAVPLEFANAKIFNRLRADVRASE